MTSGRRRTIRRRCHPSLIGLLLLTGCGGDDRPDTPTAPAAPTLRSIAIAGPASLEVGATASLTASGTYSDGVVQDLTKTVTWTSSTPSNCRVDASGLLTALTAGNCEARAVSSGITGSKALEVRSQPSPRLVEISGVVREARPGQEPIPGARIEILDGPLNGQRFTTDGSGRFSLPPLPEAPVRLHVSAEGFWNETYSVRDFPRDATLDVAMSRELRISGVVHQARPTAHVPIPGASIEILNGHLMGQRFTADGSGRFSLPPLPEGLVRLQVSAGGFLTQTYDAREFPRDATVDVGLLPEPSERTVVLSGPNQCDLPTSPFGSNGPNSTSRIIGTFDVHHSGDVTLDFAGTNIVVYEYVYFYLHRRLASGEVERRVFPGTLDWWKEPLRVEAGYTYTLEVQHTMVSCASFAGLHSPWKVTFRHPN